MPENSVHSARWICMHEMSGWAFLDKQRTSNIIKEPQTHTCVDAVVVVASNLATALEQPCQRGKTSFSFCIPCRCSSGCNLCCHNSSPRHRLRQESTCSWAVCQRVPCTRRIKVSLCAMDLQGNARMMGPRVKIHLTWAYATDVSPVRGGFEEGQEGAAAG